MKNNFKGVWIPSELLGLDISWTKRILIAEISQLEMLDKGCMASNYHFAEKLKLTNQAISKALNELAKDGFIIINNAQTKRNNGRIITINFSKSPINFSKSPINFSKSPIHQSGESKENKTINKTNRENLSPATLDFIQHRKQIKSPMTERAIELFEKKLSSLKEEGYDIELLISDAIMNGWKTIYPKEEHKTLKTSATKGWK